jgi:hypothetical protein
VLGVAVALFATAALATPDFASTQGCQLNLETRMKPSAVRRLAWLLVVIILSGCSLPEPSTSAEVRCQVRGGAWRGTFCEQGAGGGY